MKKFAFAAFILAISLLACKNETSGTQGGGNAAEATTTVDPASVQLICQPVDEPNMEADAPKHEVFIQIGDSRIKIADILNCETISSNTYEEYQVPANALSAVGGWWAGSGDYIYVIQEGGNFVVKQGEMDEGKTDLDYGYKTVMTFSSEGKEVFWDSKVVK